MAEVIIGGDFISIFTNGWFEVQEQVTAPTATSGTYRQYNNMPAWITKCTGTRYNNERELYDLFLTEVYNKHGVCLIYYVTTYNTAGNKIFGEDNNRSFVRKFEFMGFYMLPREEKLWNKFGIAGMDQFSIYVAKRHYRTASTYDYEGISAGSYSSYIPQIGDIIMADYDKYIYEIVEVKEEVGMYLLSKQHVWELIVKPFRDEKISVPASISATMPEMLKYANLKTDIYNTSAAVDTAKVPVNYVPKRCELPNANPFGNW